MAFKLIKPSPHRIESYSGKILNYALEHPFYGWSEDEVIDCARAAVSQSAVNLEIFTLAAAELQKRHGETHKGIQQIRKDFQVKTISWLSGLRHRVRSLKKEYNFSAKYPRTHKVYAILLTESSTDLSIKGVYIGQTSKTIENRFDVHKNPLSSHAAGVARRRGHQLLYSVSALLPGITKADSKEFEHLLISSLKGEGSRQPLRHLPVSWVRGR